MWQPIFARTKPAKPKTEQSRQQLTPSQMANFYCENCGAEKSNQINTKMARVWKVGSRWHEHGAAGTSIKDFFLQYNIAIIGTDSDHARVLRDVKIGDYIALADGYTIIAVGRVFEKPRRLREYNFKNTDFPGWYENHESNVGIRADFRPLTGAERFEYKKMRTFCEAFQIAGKVIELYKNLFNPFSIKPSTNLMGLMDKHYVIPIYQRPYSWEEKNVERFINDIFFNYWGEGTVSPPESMFIGTMELSNPTMRELGENTIEVVDGQQRLSTMMLLLQVLKLRYPDCNKISTIDIATKVYNGSEQSLLNQVETLPIAELKKDSTNRYLHNAFLINQYLDEKLVNNPPFCFDIDHFVDFLHNKIIFVVIEINAGLSKTLQVFNTINTAGLDLAHGDIFKLRMFEYLGSKAADFQEVSKIYNLISTNNSRIGEVESNIGEILSLYQIEIISKYNLPDPLYDYPNNRFFEELFDSILKIKQRAYFTNLSKVSLKVEDILRIIEIRYQWQKRSFISDSGIVLSALDYCNLHLIDWSRYSRYKKLIYIFINRYGKADLPKFIKYLSAFFSVYSIAFDKSIYHVHSRMNKLMKAMYFESDSEAVLKLIMENINQQMPYDKGNSKKWVDNILTNHHIADNAKRKNIICRTAAMLDEDFCELDVPKVHEIRKKLFWVPVDVEHIHSYQDEDLNIREAIHSEWGNNLNSIGNLVILEFDINRSIGNRTQSKTVGYSKSQYKSVQGLVNEVGNWTLDKCITRKEKEKERLIQYWFDE